MTRSFRNRIRNRFFTLVEILCVIAILLTLMGLVIWGAKYVHVTNAKAQTSSLFGSLESAMTQYNAEYGCYPAVSTPSPVSASWLMNTLVKGHAATAATISVTVGATTVSAQSPAIWYQQWDKFPGTVTGGVFFITDGFGNRVYYQCPGVVNKESYDLWSAGSDAMFGTEPFDATPPTTPNPQRAYYPTGSPPIDRNISCDDFTNWKSR